jgi:hypothetical protein
MVSKACQLEDVGRFSCHIYYDSGSPESCGQFTVPGSHVALSTADVGALVLEI